MAFPESPVVDDFNRAAIGANWTADPFAFAVAGIVTTGSIQATGQGGSWYNAAQYGPNLDVYVTIATLTGGANTVGIQYRLQTPGTAGVDGYELSWANGAPDTFQLAVVTNQGFTNVGAAISQNIAAGDSIGVRVYGATHEIYHKPAAGSWTLLGTRIDATHLLAGFVGLWIGDSTARLDNLGAGTVAALVPASGSRTLLGVGV